jgi:hypothetical protein
MGAGAAAAGGPDAGNGDSELQMEMAAAPTRQIRLAARPAGALAVTDGAATTASLSVLVVGPWSGAETTAGPTRHVRAPSELTPTAAGLGREAGTATGAAEAVGVAVGGGVDGASVIATAFAGFVAGGAEVGAAMVAAPTRQTRVAASFLGAAASVLGITGGEPAVVAAKAESSVCATDLAAAGDGTAIATGPTRQI